MSGAPLTIWVRSRLDYLALNLTLKRSEAELLQLATATTKACVNELNKQHNINVDVAHAIKTDISNAGLLPDENKNLLYTVIDSRLDLESMDESAINATDASPKKHTRCASHSNIRCRQPCGISVGTRTRPSHKLSASLLYMLRGVDLITHRRKQSCT